MDSGGQRPEIAWVRADYEIVAAEGSLDDSSIDDVAAGRVGQQLAHARSMSVVEVLDVAPEQHPQQMRLAFTQALLVPTAGIIRYGS